MDILQSLQSSGGIDALADQLGIDRAQAEQGAAALLPSVVDGFGQSHAAGGGALDNRLEQLGGEALLGNVIGPQPTEVAKGNDILGQIFGSKDVSREVTGHAAQSSGVSQETLKKMLPILAMLVGGLLMKRSGGAGGLGGVLGSVLGGMAGGRGMGGGLGSVLGSVLGGQLGRR